MSMTDYKNILEQVDEILVDNLEQTLISALSGGNKPHTLLIQYGQALDRIDKLVREALYPEDYKSEEEVPEPEKDPSVDLSDVFGAMGPLADAIFGKGSPAGKGGNLSEDVADLLSKIFGDPKK